MAFGIGSAIKRAGRRFDSGFSREWGRWGRDTVVDLTYGGYAGQLKALLQYGGKSTGHYSDEEAKSLGKGLGVNYQQVEQRRAMRQQTEAQQAADAEFARKQSAQEAADRNAQGVLIRRRRNRADPTKSGTLLTGALGLAGGGSSTGTQLGVV